MSATDNGIGRRLALVFGLLSALSCAGVQARAACALNQKVSVPLAYSGGRLFVSPVLNGIQSTFVLDTGAERSVVTQDAVKRLGIARDQWVGTTMSGIGGVNDRANADPRSFTLGGLPLVRHTLTHDTSLTVAPLPGFSGPGPLVDGLLGRDYLSVFDLDIDVPNRALTLYQPSGCSGGFLPWSFKYVSVLVSMPMEDALIIPAAVDGVSMRALLDTGAGRTTIAAPGMYRLGLDPTKPHGDPAERVSGLGPNSVTMGRHQFRTLQVGSLVTENPVLWVAPVHVLPIVDMLVGADWLATRRIWISYTTRQLFVAAP